VSAPEDTRLDRDDLPLFTYVSDTRGTCHECRQIFGPGATVTRVGVMWASGEGNGWRIFHADCYKLLRHKESRT
jgi:hypothetical protein